jgi:hypothetical protein
MNTEMTLRTRPVSRLAIVLSMAGVAALSPMATASAAPAAAPAAAPVVQDGPATVVKGNGHGPDAWLINRDGKKEPIFYCDSDKPNQHHNKCVDLDGERF